MIFAELQYDKDYSEFHSELLSFIKANFANVESGLQGDSWIWIAKENKKVAIDTFSSMKHQVKSEQSDNLLVNEVISCLTKKYKLVVYQEPELEPHEDV